MQNFKNPIDNSVHILDDNDDPKFLLDKGFISITDVEADDLRAPTAEELEVIRIQDLKKIRDDTLNALAHDFGDGRIMQTRPKDESNIRNAIEIMEANNISAIGWSMIDDVKQPVTVADLQAALTAGQLAALDVWNSYNP